MAIARLEATDEKARGAFYTPPSLTRFLVGWAVRDQGDTVLEPSAGDGAFVEALVERFAAIGGGSGGASLLAIEREAHEAAKVRTVAPLAQVLASDFFDVDPDSVPRVNVVVGNPPYIRYHGFSGEVRDKAQERARAQGVDLSNLASSWAHFVVHATGFLTSRGRLGLVLPAELLHTDYAGPVRAFLTSRFRSITVVAFDQAVFDSAQVDAVLLLASDDEPAGFRVVRVRSDAQLDEIDLRQVVSQTGEARWSGSVDGDTHGVYAELLAGDNVERLGCFAQVDIGFVSGANDFFILTRADAAKLNLPEALLTPIIRGPRDVPGVLIRDEEARLLLDIPRRAQLDNPTIAYLSQGELAGISQRYKCRHRTPWYSVPLPKQLPDAFLPYMHHQAPRLIVNRDQLRNSNLVHGVSLSTGAPDASALAVAMASSVTLLSAEIEGRAYGGGVLKLETKEAERLLVPVVRDSSLLEAAVGPIDTLIRRGAVAEAAALADQLLQLPHERVWQAYAVLRDRRLGRRGRGSPSARGPREIVRC